MRRQSEVIVFALHSSDSMLIPFKHSINNKPNMKSKTILQKSRMNLSKIYKY